MVKAVKPDKKFVTLIGGPFDGERLADNFKDALDRYDSNCKTTVRYYRDPNVHDCFLVDDPNDSRLLIYKVQEMAKTLDLLKVRVANHADWLSNLSETANLIDQPSRSWWRRLRDRWNLLA